MQVNKSSKKKLFNRILVDLDETENKQTKKVENEKNTKSKKTESN